MADQTAPHRLTQYLTEGIALAASGDREAGFDRLLAGIEQEERGYTAMYATACALANAAVKLGHLGGPGFTYLKTKGEPDSEGGAVVMWAARFIAAQANGDSATTEALFFGNLGSGGDPGPLVSQGLAELLVIAGDLVAATTDKGGPR